MLLWSKLDVDGFGDVDDRSKFHALPTRDSNPKPAQSAVAGQRTIERKQIANYIRTDGGAVGDVDERCATWAVFLRGSG